MENLLLAARAAGAFVVHLQNDGPAGASDEPRTAGWHIHPRVSPLTDEIVCRKLTDEGSRAPILAVCVSATARGALARRLGVVLARHAHATYDVGDISASTVARVAEHALGDEVCFIDSAAIAFRRPAADAL